MPGIISFVTLQIFSSHDRVRALISTSKFGQQRPSGALTFCVFSVPVFRPCCLHINYSPLFIGFRLRAGVRVLILFAIFRSQAPRDWPRFPLSTRNSDAVSALSVCVCSKMYNWVIFACVHLALWTRYAFVCKLLCSMYKFSCIQLHVFIDAYMYINDTQYLFLLFISGLARTSCYTGFWLNLNYNPCKAFKFKFSVSLSRRLPPPFSPSVYIYLSVNLSVSLSIYLSTVHQAVRTWPCCKWSRFTVHY